MGLTAQNVATLKSSSTRQLDVFLNSLPDTQPIKSPCLSSAVGSESAKTVEPGPKDARRPKAPEKVPLPSVDGPSTGNPRTANKCSNSDQSETEKRKSAGQTARRPPPPSSESDPEHRQRLQQRALKRAKLKGMRKGCDHAPTQASRREEQKTKKRPRSRDAQPDAHRAQVLADAQSKRRKANPTESQLQGPKQGKNFDPHRRKLATVNKDRITVRLPPGRVSQRTSLTSTLSQLREVPKYGLFLNGAASSKVQRGKNQGGALQTLALVSPWCTHTDSHPLSSLAVPDLAFHEYSFLSRAPRDTAAPTFLPTARADLRSKVRAEEPRHFERVAPCPASESNKRKPVPVRRESLSLLKAPSLQSHGALREKMNESEAGESNSDLDTDLSDAHSAYSLLLRRQRKDAAQARAGLEDVPSRVAVGAAPTRPKPPPSLVLSQTPLLSGQDRFLHRQRLHLEEDAPLWRRTWREDPALSQRLPEHRGVEQSQPLFESPSSAAHEIQDKQLDEPETAHAPTETLSAPTPETPPRSAQRCFAVDEEDEFDCNQTLEQFETYKFPTIHVSTEEICMEGWGSRNASPQAQSNSLEDDEDRPVPLYDPLDDHESEGRHPAEAFVADSLLDNHLEAWDYSQYTDGSDHYGDRVPLPHEACPNRRLFEEPSSDDESGLNTAPPPGLTPFVDACPTRSGSVDQCYADTHEPWALQQQRQEQYALIRHNFSPDLRLDALAQPVEGHPPTRLRAFLSAQSEAAQHRFRPPLFDEEEAAGFWHCEFSKIATTPSLGSARAKLSRCTQACDSRPERTDVQSGSRA